MMVKILRAAVQGRSRLGSVPILLGLFSRSLLLGRDGDSRPARLGKPDRNGLFGTLRSVLSLADMMNLFVNVSSRARRGSFLPGSASSGHEFTSLERFKGAEPSGRGLVMSSPSQAHSRGIDLHVRIGEIAR